MPWIVNIGDTVVFHKQTHLFATGAVSSADALPEFSVYQGTATGAVFSATMVSMGSTGFYQGKFTVNSSTFAVGNYCTIRTVAVVSSATAADMTPFFISATTLAELGVNLVSISSGAITNLAFTASAIDANVVANAFITNAKLAIDCIGSSQIAAGAIDNAALAAGCIGSSQLAAGAISSTKFASGAIDANAIASAAITSGSFATNAINAAAIADGAIDNAAIASGAIGSSQFAAAAITSAVIASSAIGSSQIASGTLTSAKFAAGAFTQGIFASSAINASVFATDAITAAALAADAVTEIQSSLATSAQLYSVSTAQQAALAVNISSGSSVTIVGVSALTGVDPLGIPASTGTWMSKLDFLTNWFTSRQTFNRTSGAATIFNASTSQIAAFTAVDDGTTFTRPKAG